MDNGAWTHPDLCGIVCTRAEIAVRVREMGRKIAEDYQGKVPILIGILKGAVVFFADLIRELDLELETDFMAISSYGKGTYSSGQVEIKKDLDRSIEGRHVLIVEDIVDSGLTLLHLKQMLALRNPASIRIVTLLDKPSRRRVEITPDYFGFAIEDLFVVGYGLDYAERYRNLPNIGVLKPEIYERPAGNKEIGVYK